jgi:tRNA-splicing endonuclease subunit Sen2
MSTTTQTVTRHTMNKSPKSQNRPRRPNYNHIHRNLLPVEIHPLPVLIPHNPLSLVAIVLSYLTQVLAPPVQPTSNGYFSSATSSIHVTDHETIRKLWEMGFFGRGSLSRSEPTWLENQKKKGATAEENTAQRRNERRQQKLERAKKEQEEIEQRLNEEVNGTPHENILKTNSTDISGIGSVLEAASTTLQETSGEKTNGKRMNGDANKPNGHIDGFDEWKKTVEANGLPTPPPTSTSSEASQPESRPIQRLQRTKTVRFSPTIEAREFDLSSPVISPIKSPGSSPLSEPEQKETPVQEDQEHLNLSLEEAFFLSYSLGVVNVYCDDSDTILPPSSLLSLFRRHSYHPPRSLSMPAEPDDPFMLSYVVYHHYRSLGWVVRSGVKFGVDYLLYNRGPAFSHAEFSVTILPSYSHPYWEKTEEHRQYAAEKTKKSWWWLHGVNRVQAQVHKHLILCYVEIPSPWRGEEKGKDVDVGLELSRYKVRDVTVKRWTPNRNRDS